MASGDTKRPSSAPPASRGPSAFAPPTTPAPSTRPPPAPSPSARPSVRPSRISFPALSRMASIDYDLANASRRVIEGALGVVRGERVVLIVDRAHQGIGAALLDVVRDVGADPVVHELEGISERPIRQLPDTVRANLARAQASVLVIGFEDAEMAMRVDLLEEVRARALRHAHMIGVTRASLIAGFAVDHARVLDATRAVRTRMRPDSRFRLKTAAGSDLEVRLDPSVRWSEHVGVIRPGKWENLPSGKLVTCPASVRGVFVCDASLGGQFGAAAGLLERAPVRFEIESNVCRSVKSDDRTLQRDVETFLTREHNVSRVGGVLVGTNVGILAPTGDVVTDQALPGLHIMFGQALPEGVSWTTRAQLPATCGAADVDLDGAALLRAGRYMI